MLSEELKKLESVVYLEEHVSQNLIFRDSADKLFDYINNLKNPTIFLDFAGIVFMSRAFAHQYLKNKEKMQKEIVEINKTFDITKMFAIVNDSLEKEKCA